MAPYTMNCTVVNTSAYGLKFKGFSTLSSLDGNTASGAQNASVAAKPGTGQLSVSKSGGTDGLFTCAVYEFDVPGLAGWDWLIFFSMPASLGGTVKISFADYRGNGGNVGGAADWAWRNSQRVEQDEIHLEGPIPGSRPSYAFWTVCCCRMERKGCRS